MLRHVGVNVLAYSVEKRLILRSVGVEERHDEVLDTTRHMACCTRGCEAICIAIHDDQVEGCGDMVTGEVKHVASNEDHKDDDDHKDGRGKALATPASCRRHREEYIATPDRAAQK